MFVDKLIKCLFRRYYIDADSNRFHTNTNKVYKNFLQLLFSCIGGLRIGMINGVNDKGLRLFLVRIVRLDHASFLSFLEGNIAVKKRFLTSLLNILNYFLFC